VCQKAFGKRGKIKAKVEEWIAPTYGVVPTNYGSCVKDCKFCFVELEYLGLKRYHPKPNQIPNAGRIVPACQSYEYHAAVDRLTKQFAQPYVASNPKCAHDMSDEAAYPHNLEKAVEPYTHVYHANGRRMMMPHMNLRAYMRRWAYKDFPNDIKPDELCPGDILIRHVYEDQHDDDYPFSHVVEELTSSWMINRAVPDQLKKDMDAAKSKRIHPPPQDWNGWRNASVFASHAILYLGEGMVGEAVQNGITINELPNIFYWVYRPRDREAAYQAAESMFWLTQQNIEYAYYKVALAGVTSTFVEPYVGEEQYRSVSKHKLLQKVFHPMISEMKKHATATKAKDWHNLPHSMMCVQAVVTAFNAASLGFLPLSPNTAPAVLEQYIHARPDKFIYVGKKSPDPRRFYTNTV